VQVSERIAAGDISLDASITLCTYFLSPQPMARLGFVRDSTSSEARMTALLGYLSFSGAYLDLLITRTVILGRVRWFNPFRLAFYRAPASRFAENVDYFRRQAIERGRA
jgi:hypothetical protein